MKQQVEITEFRIKPNASVNELKDFQEGHIWRDFVKYIETLNNESLIMLKNESDHDVLIRSQGCVLVAERILNLPNQMIEWAEEDHELGGDEEND